MTARRQNNAAAFGAASARSTKPAPGGVTPIPVERPARKYTIMVEADQADALDERLLRARRETGRRVHQSDWIRELIALAEEDASVASQVTDRLRP